MSSVDRETVAFLAGFWSRSIALNNVLVQTESRLFQNPDYASYKFSYWRWEHERFINSFKRPTATRVWYSQWISETIMKGNKHWIRKMALYLTDISVTPMWKCLHIITVCSRTVCDISTSSRNLFATSSRASAGQGYHKTSTRFSQPNTSMKTGRTQQGNIYLSLQPTSFIW